MANAITYKDLYLSFGEVISIDRLEITQSPNHHGQLVLSAVLDGEKEGEVFDAVPDTIAVQYMVDDEEKILFKGIVADSGMKRLGNHRKLDLKAYDSTYLLDTKRKTRSFQNTSRTNHSVIAEVMQEYPECICMKNLPEEAIGRIWFQYEETDWEFLCRFLSSYSDSLYADATYHTARFQAGLSPEDIDTDWDRLPYRMSKNLERYDYLSQNGFDGLMPQQFVEYSVDSYDLYTLGSRLKYKGREWYIGALTRTLREGLLVNTYELKQKEGMLVPPSYNEQITGISVDGSTAEIHRDKVRVTINGDMTTEQGTYWFPFSTVAASADGSGWYSMPEKGDPIRVYFPTCDEKEGYVITKHGSHTPAPKSGGKSISGGGSGGNRSLGNVPASEEMMDVLSLEKQVQPTGFKEVSMKSVGLLGVEAVEFSTTKKFHKLRDDGDKGFGVLRVESDGKPKALKPKLGQSLEIKEFSSGIGLQKLDLEDSKLKPINLSGVDSMQSIELMGDYGDASDSNDAGDMGVGSFGVSSFAVDSHSGGIGLGSGGVGYSNSGSYSGGGSSGGGSGYSGGGSSGGGSSYSGGAGSGATGYGAAAALGAEDALAGAEESENPMDDPTKRNIFTQDGCIVQMVPTGVILSAGKSSISLKKTGEIIFDAPMGISIYAGESLNMEGMKLSMEAGTMMEFKNEAGADIRIAKTNIRLHGKEIYEN